MSDRLHPVFAAAKAKLRKAFEDLDSLDTEIERFRNLQPSPYSLAVEFEPNTGWWVAEARINQEPSPDLGVLVGSVAYQCLSAFNLLVWELAARKIGRREVWKHRGNVQIPVVRSSAAFANTTLVRCKTSRGPGMVSQKALAKIERLQPHKEGHGASGPDEHPLHLIQEIANSDKHRVLAPTVAAVDYRRLDFLVNPEASDPTYEPLIAPGDFIQPGTPIGRIRFGVNGDKADVRMERQPDFGVAFKTDSWVIGAGELRWAAGWADNRVQRFASLFPTR